MVRHFSRVMEFRAGKYGQGPMMWSDMFFKLATATYYCKEFHFKEEVANRFRMTSRCFIGTIIRQTRRSTDGNDFQPPQSRPECRLCGRRA